VLHSFRAMYPEMVLGLSDHTPGHATVLGAVTLGARIIEKHFTDDVARTGPDHAFSMDPRTWREMVDRTRELELSLGTGIKRVEANEQETVVLQRRAVRARNAIEAGQVLRREDLEVLRPCPRDAVDAAHVDSILGRQLRKSKVSGEHLLWTDFD
jgi:sialic acid synthase SpsE